MPQLAIPEVEIIQDGRTVSQERMDPAIMQFLMQASATAQLVKLRKLEESKVPIGVKSIKSLVGITGMTILANPPWISFSLINDGPGAITVWINDEKEPLSNDMIASDETYNLDMGYPIIHTLHVKSYDGTSSIVRIYGKEGKSSE